MQKANSREILLSELTSRLLMLLEGRWYDLPRTLRNDSQRLTDARQKRRRARVRFAASAVTAVILVGAAIFAVTKLNESSAALITPFLLSTAITVLGVGGVELKALSDSTSITEKAIKESRASQEGNLGG